MITPSIAELRDVWTRRNVATSKLSRTGIKLLADGKPVPAAALAEAAGISLDEAVSYIEMGRQYGIQVEDGTLVGAALTLRPTEHRFRIRGNDLFAWCGFDTLLLAIILEERAEVTSACPVTGSEIRLTVEADGTVSDVTPSSVVVGIVGEQVMSSCAFIGPDSAICIQMPFLASAEAGARWLADHPGVAVVDLDEAREVARACASTPADGP